jgi:hypothetical protein
MSNASFEKWALHAKGFDLSATLFGGYMNDETQAAWEVWQAAEENCEAVTAALLEALESITTEAEAFASVIQAYRGSEPLAKARAAIALAKEQE